MGLSSGNQGHSAFGQSAVPGAALGLRAAQAPARARTGRRAPGTQCASENTARNARNAVRKRAQAGLAQQLLLIVALAHAGCVSDPVLELYGARVAYASPVGVGLELTMKVTNENSFDVEVSRVRAGVVIEERIRLPNIDVAPRQWLNAGRSTLVRVPVMIPWPSVAPLLSLSVGEQELNYTMRGSADLTVTRSFGINVKRHEIEEEGGFSRAQLLGAAGRGMFSR